MEGGVEAASQHPGGDPRKQPVQRTAASCSIPHLALKVVEQEDEVAVGHAQRAQRRAVVRQVGKAGQRGLVLGGQLWRR